MTAITNNLPSIVIDNSVSASNVNQVANDAIIPSTQDAPAYTLILSKEAQAALESTVTVEQSKPAKDNQPFDIQANLQIDTPRPAIKYTITNWFRWDGKGVDNAVEERNAFIKQLGDPLDRMLDIAYKDIAGMESKLEDIPPVSATESVKSDHVTMSGDFANVLQMVKTNNEYYGISDYAQEVFAKRSGGAIDLNALYEQYLG